MVRDTNTMTKFCRRCGKVKPASEFSANRRNRDGLHSYCKPCLLEYHNLWLAHHPNYDRDRMRRKRERSKQCLI